MFAVTIGHGSGWDSSQPIEGQRMWPEHAEYMDLLVDDGFIVLGGPLGDGERVLMAIEAEDEDAIRARLAPDPWHEHDLLNIAAIEPWEIRLDARSS